VTAASQPATLAGAARLRARTGHVREVGTLAGLLSLCVALWIATPHFMTASNLLNVVEQSAVIGVLAVGMTFVILTGGIDLSVGSLVALSGVVFGLAVRGGASEVAGVVAALAAGVSCGIVNGALITVGRLPPFIATLGMMSVARGFALVLSDGRPISGFDASFRLLSTGRLAGVPVPTLVMLATYAAAAFILSRTVLGRYTYAVGGNEEATVLAGVNVKRVKTTVYAISGLLSALTALLLVARLNSAQPIAGISYELDAIAAVVIGGASLLGGSGTVLGTLIGALIMAVLRNGLNLLGVSSYIQQIAIGGVIIGAVLIDMTLHRRAARRVLTIALAAGVLSGCNRGADSSDRPTIALVMKTLNNAFFVEMEQGARAAADSLRLNLLVQAPEREIDVEKQMQIVENLIQRRVNALALVPNGSREIVPAVVKANQARVPVLIVDTRVDTMALRQAAGTVATFIGSDNIDGGRLAGQFIVTRLGGRGRIAILEGIPGHETGDSRLRGVREALAKHPGIVVVASQTANWERDQAFNVMQNILQSHPTVQAVFAANDVMALGAVEAIAAAGRTGRIVVVGFDAQDDARAAIREGRMDATIAQNPREMGRMAVVAAHRLLSGESLPAEQPVPIELVSKENVGTK
jgi:ribose transport system permease protein